METDYFSKSGMGLLGFTCEFVEETMKVGHVTVFELRSLARGGLKPVAQVLIQVVWQIRRDSFYMLHDVMLDCED